MTAQEVSTLIRQRCPAVFLLVNNDGYLIERLLHEDGPYNDLQMWNYAGLPEIFGGGTMVEAFKVGTEEELERALTRVSAQPSKLFFIEAIISDRSCSAGLKRLGEAFMKKS
jgi:indolepyruvate decarboxylase